LGQYYFRGPYATASRNLFYLGATLTDTPDIVMLDTGNNEGIINLGAVNTWVSTVSYAGSSSSGGGGTPPDGSTDDGTPQLPQEAIDACTGLSEGAACSVQTPAGQTMSGTRATQNSVLACSPADMGSPPDDSSTDTTSSSGEVTQPAPQSIPWTAARKSSRISPAPAARPTPAWCVSRTPPN
jgi:hypothetical protein